MIWRIPPKFSQFETAGEIKFEEPSLRPWKINCRHNFGIEKNHVRVVDAAVEKSEALRNVAVFIVRT